LTNAKLSITSQKDVCVSYGRLVSVLFLAFFLAYAFMFPSVSCSTVQVPSGTLLCVPSGVKLHLGSNYVSSTSTPMRISAWQSNNWVNYTVDNAGTQEIFNSTISPTIKPTTVIIDGSVQAEGAGWTYVGGVTTVSMALGSVAIHYAVPVVTGSPAIGSSGYVPPVVPTQPVNASQASVRIVAGAGGVTLPSAGDYVLDKNSSLTLTAVPDANFTFNCWVFDNGTVVNAQSFVLVCDRTLAVEAHFTSSVPSEIPWGVVAVVGLVAVAVAVVGDETKGKAHLSSSRKRLSASRLKAQTRHVKWKKVKAKPRKWHTEQKWD